MGIGFNNSKRQEIPTLMVFLFSFFCFLKSLSSGLRLKLFVLIFKGAARLKNYSKCQLGLGSARLEVQNLSWAQLGLGTKIEIGARLGLGTNSKN